MSTIVTILMVYRLLVRAGKVAAQPGTPQSVKQVYDDLLAAYATAFCKAHEAVVSAQADSVATRRKLQEEIEVFNSPYCTVRAVVLAYFPGQPLPETLKVQRTDTDIETALTALLSLLESHASEPWAEALLNGEFGTLAPKVIATLAELDAARTALVEARQARAKAQQPAYERLVAFRRVVRNALGSSSAQYQRLRLRSRAVPAEATEEAAPDSAVVPSTKSGQALQAGGPASVRIA